MFTRLFLQHAQWLLCKENISVAGQVTSRTVGWLMDAPGPSDDAVQRIQAVANLVSTVRAAVEEHQHHHEAFHERQQACFQVDVSWANPAQQWEQALRSLLTNS